MNNDENTIKGFDFYSEIPEKTLIILEEAKKEFSRCGFYEASVDNIASNAGVGKGTVYRHFGDKETLFFYVVGYNFKTFYDMVKNESPSNSFETDIKNFIYKYIDKYYEDRDFVQLLFHQFSKLMVNPTWRKQIIEFFNAGIPILMEMIKKGKKRDEIDNSMDEQIFANYIMEQVHSVPKRIIIFNYSIEEAKKYADFVVYLMINGTKRRT